MERQFNLVKNDQPEVEKRVFPRFPFSYLTFKDHSQDKSPTFQVSNISKTGMQLALKNGGHSFIVGQQVKGTVQWREARVSIVGKVMWSKGPYLGVSFSQEVKTGKEIANFLSIEHIVSYMRPVHNCGLELNIPADLSHWLQADGPVELFIWQHKDCELKRFQVLFLDLFVEWQDGQGPKSGELIRKKDRELPLLQEDEFLFQFDTSLCAKKVSVAKKIVEHLPENYISADIRRFLLLKLGD